ncbi:YraN family protein [Kaarinaea lacus]
MGLFSGSANTSVAIGQRAEDAALRYLQAQGLQLIERNYRCKAGEIDLIMQHNSDLVFIEVRFRRQPRFGSGAESVDFRKQQKLVKSAESFLQQHSEYSRTSCRIDVVSISVENNNSENRPDIHWIPDAVQA